MIMSQRKNTKAVMISRLFFVVLVIAGIIGSLIGNWSDRKAEPNIVRQSDPSTIVTTATGQESQENLIPVYLVGAVVRPGIYHIKPGSYLYQLVEMAGGLLDIAASDRINLVMQLNDSQLIRIPTHEEANAGQSAEWIGEKTQASPMIDINRADSALLEKLPGIGPATAQAIIAYRSKNGPFQRVEDLMKVAGIKESRFEQVKDLIVAK